MNLSCTGEIMDCYMFRDLLIFTDTFVDVQWSCVQERIHSSDVKF